MDKRRVRDGLALAVVAIAVAAVVAAIVFSLVVAGIDWYLQGWEW